MKSYEGCWPNYAWSLFFLTLLAHLCVAPSERYTPQSPAPTVPPISINFEGSFHHILPLGVLLLGLPRVIRLLWCIAGSAPEVPYHVLCLFNSKSTHGPLYPTVLGELSACHYRSRLRIQPRPLVLVPHLPLLRPLV
jgi:hypothetical protein